jgi:hypothetical protein
MTSSRLVPVEDPYQATVLVGYLARAFNPRAKGVPYAESPLWPIACAMIEAMARDHYALGHTLTSDHFVTLHAQHVNSGPRRALSGTRTR